MFLDEEFKKFTEKRHKINDIYNQYKQEQKMAYKMDTYNSFYTYHGAAFYGLFAIAAAVVLFGFVAIVMMLTYTKITGSNTIPEGFFIFSILSGIVLGICFLYSIMKGKIVRLRQYLKNKPMMKQHYKNAKIIRNEYDEKLENFRKELTSFDMKKHLENKTLQYFNDLDKDSLDVIDDYKEIIKINRSIENYLQFNNNDKAVNYLITD